MYVYIYIYIPVHAYHSHVLYIYSPSLCLHRSLDVYGNPLGCVLVPESVAHFDTSAVYYGYDETARCGDNCSQHTVYLPSDGVCVQCPGGTHTHGVGALNCSVVSPTRCSLLLLLCCSVLQCCSAAPTWCCLVQLTCCSLSLRLLLLHLHVWLSV